MVRESRRITDNGGVFRAKQLLAICEALEIEKEHIHPRETRENPVETHFNVMRRMSQLPTRAGDQLAGHQAGERSICDRLQCSTPLGPRAPAMTTASVPAPVLGQKEDQQTAHSRAVVSDFLYNTLSPPIRSVGLRAFSAVETLWGRGAGPSSHRNLAAW